MPGMRVLNFLFTVAELELVRAGGSDLAVSSESVNQQRPQEPPA